uniref:Pre-mRNA-splicing factor SLU7 n=1 Tax=Percolomonas cosmopolitus TaxID=63605 RepID=A0A7S1PII6_9EUKA|mmetsp:Transcript_7100/g.26582  ORF Transcript_7100/g.26582 Transcript_7100/m.26582 type:complete len:471 (+) Transcript_7100:151-1563(+)|eukprot:CAMPEP_0117441552 /NCGR_PEP_ID=MMETSP0759-20121206/3693_1 /TAXON_ID=63605 /ORGANISM="Percolomonas cosmopolitus, Strain WS" /LENGTH=470 /DNA_ID=CAMNT_0005233409 /DNA_START=175 /DNA_END=1587 /DNA_ORIENTATION=-
MSSLSRQQFVRKKELEEARKAGQAPAEVDEHGRDINPHIPKYIASAPWYLDKGVPSLKHQKKLDSHNDDENGDGSSKKMPGVIEVPSFLKKRGKAQIVNHAMTYRKGSCRNCGSMDHKTSDCMERPRRRGAHLTGEEIAADREVHDLNAKVSYDAKRDRWAAYTPSMYREKVVQRHERIEKERKKHREKEMRERLLKGTNAEANTDGTTASEDLKQRDETIFGMGADSRTRTNSKNLRIREDIPKYLRNLDTDTHYDAKTRSMRENPNPDVPLDQLDYAGDNAYRTTGEYREWLDTQKFAWELAEKGQRINTAALPSQVEKLHKQLKERKKKHLEQHKADLIKKYGGEEHFKKPKQLAATQETEYYAEYSRSSGKIIGGHKKLMQKSKFDEDEFINGHTSVFGSFWKDGKWGFACCQCTNKLAKCPLSEEDGVLENGSGMKRKREDTAVTAGEIGEPDAKRTRTNAEASE